MKESEAKLTWCHRTQRSGTLDGNGNFVLDSKCCCYTRRCTVWEPEYEKKEIELKPNETPSGEGWKREQRAPGQPNFIWSRWEVTDSGDCGLKSKEQGCFYPG